MVDTVKSSSIQAAETAASNAASAVKNEADVIVAHNKNVISYVLIAVVVIAVIAGLYFIL